VKDERIEIGFIERETIARARDINHHIVYDAKGVATEVNSAKYHYDQLTTFEDLIILIIHCVKKFHLEHFPNAVDIRFTGSRGGDLPFVIEPCFKSGKIEIEQTRSLKINTAIQTFNTVNIRAANGSSLACMIGFSYRIAEQ
jgi:hypothetical protein